MYKPVIAVDIDDVLADSTEHLRLQVNDRLGIDLQPHHYAVPGEYWGYYEKVWEVNGVAHRITLEELDPIMVEDQSDVQPYAQAREVLQELAKCYRLIVVTARDVSWEPATKRWLQERFPNMFEGMHFAGHEKGKLTKGQLCKRLGAEWLIDDNVNHAHTALDEGIRVILFGDYGWHQGAKVHDDVVRCKDWPAVSEYFDGIA